MVFEAALIKIGSTGSLLLTLASLSKYSRIPGPDTVSPKAGLAQSTVLDKKDQMHGRRVVIEFYPPRLLADAIASLTVNM
jgi:hypothetical protein